MRMREPLLPFGVRDFEMHLSIIAVLLLPFLLLAGALVKAGTGIVRTLGRRQAPRLPSIVAFFSGLLLVDGVLSVVIIANAALGHSEAAKAASPWYCLALFFVLVAAPAAALFAAVRGVRAAHRTPPPDRA
jgi:hypothetical protein